MDKNKSTYFRVGTLLFTLSYRLRKLDKSPKVMFRQFFASPLVFGLNLIFMAVDAVNFWNLYRAVANDSLLLEVGLVIFSVLLLDFTGLILGHSLKQKAQGYEVEKLPVAAGFIAFGLAIFINFSYRFVFAHKLFPPTLYTVYVHHQPQIQTLDASFWTALNYSLIPLAVLALTFAVTFLFSNPRLEELWLEEEKLEVLKAEQSRMVAIMKAYEGSDYREKIQRYDNENFAKAQEQVQIQSDIFKNELREILKLKLKTPRVTSYLSREVKNAPATAAKETEPKKSSKKGK